ncbi:MAG: TonB-dependent receptor plug domain-containing protein [Paludibacter sp.]|nr:TonB-dependent receptor plug domain-containing protein [Paludibacter sp.]
MNRLSISCVLLCLVMLPVSSQNRTISGYITNAKNGETLLNSSVYEKNSKVGNVSNSYGFYSLTIPKGAINLVYSYVGFTSKSSSFVLTKDTVINIQLTENTELDEVVVLGSRKELGVQGSQMSAIEVPISQIKSVPSLFGETDVIKALQLLPGVKAGTEGSAGMYVRGGGPDENLLLLDGVPVYNVNHMFGFFSVFNADAIKNVTLYKGSFPARFGGRLSSVVDIRMNDGDDKNYHGNVTVGLISSKINIEGPIIKEKTTFNFSARRTYADILAQPIITAAAKKNGGVGRANAGYYFYDLNAKISHKFSDKDRLYLSAYMGDDVIYANLQQSYSDYGNSSEAGRIKMDWDWGNLITAVRWNHLINNKLFMNTTAAYTRYRFYMAVGTENKTVIENPPSTSTEKLTVGYRSGIEDYSAKVDFDWSPMPNHDVKFGANYTFHTFRPGVTIAQLKTTGESMNQQMDTTIGDQNVSAHETTAYIEDNISLGSVIKLNAGVHFSSFLVQNQLYGSVLPQPRIGLRVLMSDKMSFKVGYATMSQYIHLLSNSNISLPTDLWVPVTKRIAPMNSNQYSAGLFYNLANLIDFSVEGYYKTMDNLIEYKDGASFFGSSTGWEDKVSMGRGWAYGIEFLAQKTVGNTTGWVGYTWSHSDRLFDRPGQEINEGAVFPAKYDRRHDLSVVVSHKFSDRFDMAATWVYSTGNCGTLALQNFGGTDLPQSTSSFSGPTVYNGNGSVIAVSNPITTTLPYVSSRNNFRYNPYHRLDIGMNFHKQLKHGRRTWNISVYNAYNQLNPFLTMVTNKYTNNMNGGWGTERKALTQLSIFPIIPSVSYSYKF